MARSRIIKPGFFSNEDLGALAPLTRLLFAGIWTIADRAGRLEDRPAKIKAAILPYDQCDGEEMISRLVSCGFLLRYEADGKRYLQVVNWTAHQQPHVKEASSTIPAPEEHGTSTVQAPDMQGASTVLAPKEHGTSTEDARLVTSYVINPPLPPLAGGDAPNTAMQPADTGHPVAQTNGAKPTRATREAPRTRAPDMLAITDADYAWATAECDLDREAVDFETKQFLDHHAAKGTLMAQWHRGWQEWMRNTRKYGTRAPQSGTRRNGYISQADINRREPGKVAI